MNKVIYFLALINSIILAYLYKFSIDPFLPVNISFFLDDVHEHDLPGFVVFGKILMEICNLELVELLRLPVALLPTFFLTFAVVGRVVSNKDWIFYICPIVIIFGEGLYLFVHHVSYILFLTFFLCLLLIEKQNIRNFEQTIIALYLSFTTLTILGYKLPYMAILILTTYLIFLYLFNENINHIFVVFITCIVVFWGFHRFLEVSFPTFVYYLNEASFIGLERWFNALIKSPINYCYHNICFDPYYYPSSIISAFGHGGIYLIIFISIILFLKIFIIQKNERRLKLLILSFFIAGSLLALMYSLMGFFHFSYSILPGTLIAGYVLPKFKKYSKIIITLIIFLILFSYTGTISLHEQRFNPFGYYVSLTDQGTRWVSNHGKTEAMIYSDVFSRGFYTFYWKKIKESPEPSWLTLEDLSKFIENNKNGILILNFGVPWWEMENWIKILPPKKYFSEIIYNRNIIYSSENSFYIVVYEGESQ